MLETNETLKAQQNSSAQINLSERPSIHIPTEGIKYSGSKLKLLPYILSVVRSFACETNF